MILWICIVIVIIGFILAAISYAKATDIWDVIGCVSVTLAVLSFAASIILGVIAIVANVRSESYLASMQEKRNVLVYQLENNLYDNDNDIGKKELYSEIADYNCEVAKGKIMQDNIWVCNLYADVYNELDFIEFPDE